MEIIPAIDIKDGRCVRLYQGDYTLETVYSNNPVEMAIRWQSLGATRLHIIDLDGADLGVSRNLRTITQINDAVWIPLQVGGGIRTMEAIGKLLKMGIDRVILGTVAIENTELVKEACRRFGNSIIIGIDTREGRVATRGWKTETEITATELAMSMAKLGAKRFIYTDISRDGTLTEPNFLTIFELIDSIRYPVIASGGVSSIVHLKLLDRLGVEGAIIGKALYTGDINLDIALKMVA
ncbi:MAG: 1-(5-phosphoribosyl)-5-[(5-phosphoribosylamino)methylideneamino]imidazole-4-carboxamide isomerase [Dehalococcoidia bacterium]|nr:MAG: 1-(5-phosphoribosyl)-5-[(5-phosphoribosylamino)methylideneamino]imidazole-4-carboxamide isomerase [Dehalococcoidia bacterium]